MLSHRRLALAALAALSLVLAVSIAAAAPRSHKPLPKKPTATKVLFFTSDGMRPDLMEKYAAAGQMPTYASLLQNGVRGDNGLEQAFPPNTGIGWYTLMTGTWPSEHGSTNNTFHRTGDSFSSRTSFSSPNVLQADTLAAAAERRGKKVAQVEWVGGIQSKINGPTVDFANFYSTRGVLAMPENATEKAGAAAFGISYQTASFSPATGWTNVPANDAAAPPQQTTLQVVSTFAAQNPSRTYDILIYDSSANGQAAYDRVALVPSNAGKDAGQAAVTLAVGDFKDIKLKGDQGLIGPRAGETADFYAKLITMSGDLSTFKLYFTSVARVIASCHTAACDALPAGVPGEDRLEKYIADNLPGYQAADFAPEEAGIIDEDTYVQQGRDLEKAYGDAVMNYVLKTLQPDTEVAFVGYPVTDEFSHQFMGLVTPTDMEGKANPYYDDINGDGVKDNRLAIREGFIQSAYHEADAKLAEARQLLGGDPTTFATSDHGFAPQWYAVNARKVLFDAQVKGTSLQASGGSTASNCGAAKDDLAKACWAGGTIQIYVNPTLPSGTSYEDVRSAVIAAFQNLKDPANPDAKVVDKVLKKEELRNVDGDDSLHPNRSGDVVVVLRPPYQSDAGTPGKAIAFSQFFGQHGFMPNLVDLAHNVNMHATFVAAGAGVAKSSTPIPNVRAIDLAPTIAFLLGIPGPENARGKILYGVTSASPSQYKEITLLQISDYHGQLIPLSEASDSVGPTFQIGGAAVLKSWFDWYRAEAKDGSLTMSGGDSIGATPPISAFFGDKPTVEIMDLMGFSLDGIGNHNFDKGQDYFKTQIIPLSKHPFLSSNIFEANGTVPKEWAKSKVFTIGGVKVGVIGFSNPDIPQLVNPQFFMPLQVKDPAPRVNAEAKRLRSQGVKTIIAIGHLGDTLGATTPQQPKPNPSVAGPGGPLTDLALQLAPPGASSKNYVDVLMGDHSDFQVSALGYHNMLITENRSRGIRFTRVRLTIDAKTGRVAYRTADWHRPWGIGVTPDGAIQAKVDALNAQLGPILSTVIGSSTVVIPRADACGNSLGRVCESRLGDLVSDALRKTYNVDFAITNSGGLRADLTCPTTDNPQDFCPDYTPPPFQISRGQVLTVLPFGNIVVTVNVTGKQLKDQLENGVFLTGPQGRFPQVSGLCFTYDLSQPPGSRVTAVFRADDNGCTTTAVDLSETAKYSLAENDFMGFGGDGYLFLADKVQTRDIMDEVLADYIKSHTPVNPQIQGRSKCTGPGCPSPTP